MPLFVVAVSPDWEIIRFSLWAPLEAYPGSGEVFDTDNPFAYPIQRLKELVPFFIEGMVCGWSFSYTPSDKTRNVAEHFEFSPLRTYPDLTKNIQYMEPWIKENRLYAWIEFPCSPEITAWRKSWEKSQYKKISGRGSGLLTDGFDGIYEGTSKALKEAIRGYVRSITKNKPQEISGEVLITGLPKIGIKSGRYLVDLDFFLNVSRIRDYKMY